MKKEVNIEHCHACGENMRVEMDLDLNGNHIIECPHCNHKHCRVVENGKITRVRWDSRNNWGNQPTYYAYTTAYLNDASDSTAGSTFLRDSWNSTTNSG